ncbi:MAG TPA: exopolysaccharide biosynthesis polyprenyl glycosylphosphotransferase [Amycolatopsis sp.]|nr:exopolysaccharide biosynthesis polyprenyl glycosylphosphotransferase [Amycolatopsis sp.]
MTVLTRPRPSGLRASPTRGGRVRLHLTATVRPAADLAATAGAMAVTETLGWAAAAYLALVPAGMAVAGQYRARLCPRLSDRIPRLVAPVLLAAPVLLVWFSPGVVLFVALCTAGMAVAGRAAVSAVLRHEHRRGRLLEPTLVVGAGAPGTDLARSLRAHPEFGSWVAGFLDDRLPDGDAPAPLLGRVADLPAIARRHRIRRVIVCCSSEAEDRLSGVLRQARALRLEIFVVPRSAELGPALPRSGVDEVRGVPLLAVRGERYRSIGRVVKRAFDLLVGGALVALLAPVLLSLALVLRIDGGRGVFFRQWRVVGARQARITKFRTMPADADADLRWRVPVERCTRLGRWLRATHLDELPQLFNVLRGEMSLVGPRPERPYFARRFGRRIPHYDDRHRMPAGITGWAQVHGLHGDTSIAERARFDNNYIEYWSLWLDVTILARTLGTVRFGGSRR